MASAFQTSAGEVRCAVCQTPLSSTRTGGHPASTCACFSARRQNFIVEDCNRADVISGYSSCPHSQPGNSRHCCSREGCVFERVQLSRGNGRVFVRQ